MALGPRFTYTQPLPCREAWLQPSPGPLLLSASVFVQPWSGLYSPSPCVSSPHDQHFASGEQCPQGPWPEPFQALRGIEDKQSWTNGGSGGWRGGRPALGPTEILWQRRVSHQAPVSLSGGDGRMLMVTRDPLGSLSKPYTKTVHGWSHLGTQPWKTGHSGPQRALPRSPI